MADIFISYKREDLVLAKTLASHLQNAGWSVWWDHEIPSGKDYDLVIEKELDKCKCAIVLWTPESIHSRNVKDEANVALQKNKLIPVMVDNVQPPLGFRMIQGVKWDNNNTIDEDEMNDLRKQVMNMLSASPEQMIVMNKKTVIPSPKRKWIIASAVIAIIIFGVYFSGRNTTNNTAQADDITADSNAQANDKTANEYAEMGANLADNNKDYDGAIANFSKAIALDTNLAFAYYGRGTTYNLKGMQSRAIEDLEKSIKLGNNQALGNLAWVYFDIGNYNVAIENFAEHCKYEVNALSEAGAAMSFFILNNPDSAKGRYDNAIKLDARYDGNFEALSNDIYFTERQFRTLKSTYNNLYKK